MGRGGLLLTYAALDYTQAGLGGGWGLPAIPNNKAGEVYRGVTTAIAPPHAAKRPDTNWPDVNTQGF